MGQPALLSYFFYSYLQRVDSSLLPQLEKALVYQMKSWVITTGVGYRMYMYATLAWYLAILAFASIGMFAEAMFVGFFGGNYEPKELLIGKDGAFGERPTFSILFYIIPAGHGISFIGGVGWLTSLPGKAIHWAIFACTQVYMSMIYVAFISKLSYPILVGMPVLAIATIALIFISGKDVLGGDTIAKVSVSGSLLAFTGGSFGMENPFIAITLWVLSFIVIEVGYYIGMKRAREYDKRKEVPLIDPMQQEASYGSYVPRTSIGSVRVISSA
jgi:hypothetical protein